MYDVLMVLLAAYCSIAFAKTLLMLSTAHIAAGVHLRVQRRMGFEVSFFKCLMMMFFVVPFIVFFSMPIAIYRERWAFFTVYSKRETIRDILSEYRTDGLKSISKS